MNISNFTGADLEEIISPAENLHLDRDDIMIDNMRYKLHNDYYKMEKEAWETYIPELERICGNYNKPMLRVAAPMLYQKIYNIEPDTNSKHYKLWLQIAKYYCPHKSKSGSYVNRIDGIRYNSVLRFHRGWTARKPKHLLLRSELCQKNS